LARGRFLKR